MYEIEDQAYLLEEVIDRLNNLIRIGKICEVSEDGRVKVKTGDITTDWLDVIQKAGKSIQKYSPPTLSEAVVIVSPMGDLNQGMVIPGLFTKANPAPKNPDDRSVSQHEVHKYTKGSEHLTLSFKAGKLCIENQKSSLIDALVDALISLKAATAGGDPLTFPDGKFDKAIEDIKSFS